MNSVNGITQLPVEIIKEIFKYLMQHNVQHPLSMSSPVPCKFISAKHKQLYPGRANPQLVKENDGNVCLCWQLDMLSVALVCKSWYLIGHEIISWLPLVNHSDDSRKYPFRSRLVSIMKESKLANLAFHQKVRHLVLDFASFDTIPSKSAKSTQNSDGIPTALSEMTDLIELCTQIEKLDIVFDADFKKLVSCTSIASYNAEDADSISMKNCILDSCNFLQQALIQQHGNDRVRRLDFIGIDPTRRCPCCMGAKWDQYLFPLLTCLVKVETLVLHNVVPSVDAFEALGSPNLTKIVFYKSVVTISAIKEGTSPRGKSSTSFDRIPPKLWKQIKHIEIYEDIEEATTWQITKYLTKLVNNVHDLESFVLQFDTKEANEKCLSLTQGSNINSIPVKDTLDSGHRIANTSSPLYHLQMKCKNTLNMITLVNVPSDM